MRKILILMSLLIILTGCTMEYNLVIDNKTFEEFISITEDNASNWDKVCEADGVDSYRERIEWLKDIPLPVYKNAEMDPYDPTISLDDVDYYKKEIVREDNVYGIKMIANGSIVEINNLKSLSHCYDIAQVINNNDEYILSTSLRNVCFEQYTLLDEININITTDMKVISNNADSVNGNTYTWKITRENYENKSISLEMQSIRDYNQDKYGEEQAKIKEENRKKMEKQKGTALTILAVIGSVFLVIVVCLGILILIKNRRENKI